MARFRDGGTRVVIVGGGVAGIRTARMLSRMKLPGVKIQLISDSPHFEYHGALYRLVAGSSPLEVCVPLRDIFDEKQVEVVEDEIVDVHIPSRQVIGRSGSKYWYTYLVLALGAESDRFGIEGLKEHAHEARTIRGALRLKNHIHDVLQKACKTDDPAKKLRAGHMAVVGAGATGVELAGELAGYACSVCNAHGMEESYVTVELIEAKPHVLPALPARFSEKVEARLRELRVNILTNRTVERVSKRQVSLRGMKIDTNTVIWSAGVRAHHLYATVPEFETDEKGAVIVNEHLHPAKCPAVFVLGDGAATAYAGWAQTALQDGVFAARAIRSFVKGVPQTRYRPRAPLTVIPVGPRYAAARSGPFAVYDRLGWTVRRLADLRIYLALLPFSKALLAFRSGGTARTGQ